MKILGSYGLKITTGNEHLMIQHPVGQLSFSDLTFETGTHSFLELQGCMKISCMLLSIADQIKHL
jgi:hypothetical protein